MKKETAKSGKRKPRVHKELDGLELTVDSFGEISSSLNIEKINAFLDQNVDDKKLREREEALAKKQAERKKSTPRKK